jgi:hypothetical protein
MKRIAMVGSMIVCCAVVGAAAAATASATLPEFGRCVAVTPKTGEYMGKNCVTPAPGTGKYNFLPGPGVQKKFTTNVEGSTLRTAGGKEIKCESGEGEGEYTGPKTVSVTKLVFRNCSIAGAKTIYEGFCQNIGAFRGEVTANELVGELGFIVGGEKPRVGLDFKAKTGKVLASFECGGATELTEHGLGTGTLLEVEGSVIGRILPINRMTQESFVSFVAKKGVQMPEQFEGGEKDTLVTLVGLEKTPEASTFSGIADMIGEEPIEVKGK